MTSFPIRTQIVKDAEGGRLTYQQIARHHGLDIEAVYDVIREVAEEQLGRAFFSKLAGRRSRAKAESQKEKPAPLWTLFCNFADVASWDEIQSWAAQPKDSAA
jgi:transposase-like protein